MAMDSAQKKAYLAAMGIHVWVPRSQPLEEVATVIDEPTAPLNEETVAPSSEPAPASPHEDRLVQPKVEPAFVLESEKEAAAAADAIVDSANEIERPSVSDNAQTAVPIFNLVAVALAERCLVLSDMPVASGKHYSQDHQKLLIELLRALGVQAEQEPDIAAFSWPLTKSAGINQGPQVAAEAVQAFLSKQCKDHSPGFVLLMGEAAARFMLPNEQGFDEARGGLDTWNGVDLAVTHGLDLLLTLPGFKKEAWLDLQPLRHRLLDMQESGEH